jgi:hypothetical protein
MLQGYCSLIDQLRIGTRGMIGKIGITGVSTMRVKRGGVGIEKGAKVPRIDEIDTGTRGSAVLEVLSKALQLWYCWLV